MAAVWNRVARCSTGCRSAETVFLEVSGAELAYFEDPCLMSLHCRWDIKHGSWWDRRVDAILLT